MPSLSFHVQDITLNWLKGIAPPPPPAYLEVGLLTVAPNADGSGVSEPIGAGYARQRLALSDTVRSGVQSSVKNLTPIVFSPSGQWPTVAYMAAFGDDGSLLFSGPLAAARTAGGNENITFGSGTIQLRTK